MSSQYLRVKKDDLEFVNQEINRICQKLLVDQVYRVKIYELYDKLYEIIVYGVEFLSKTLHWNESERKEAEEGLNLIQEAFSDAKEIFREEYYDYLKRNQNEIDSTLFNFCLKFYSLDNCP